ncbi:CDP-diacylglycerol--glycerol-3-phosphate 3-phosphatidyltransferase [Peptoniphilaceae bacterium SGI.131]
MWKKFNLANKLTMIRLLMVPVFIVLFEIFKTDNIIPALVFSLTAFTDFLDGYIARSRNMVTTFGKFMDPLVDKVLTQAGFILLAGAGFIPSWTVIVIVFRELMITGLRTVAASNNVTIAASVFGKVKTISQFASIILYLLKDTFAINFVLLQVVLYISVFLTIISGLDYLIKNSKVLDLKDI